MVGRIIYTTNKQEIFIPNHCEFCNLDTGGNHATNCPYYKAKRPNLFILKKDLTEEV